MADNLTNTTKEREEVEMMSERALRRLLEYLKSIGWTDSQIVALLTYITNGK
jgi:hypothetical protein